MNQINYVNHHSFSMTPTHPEEIRKMLMPIKPKTSYGINIDEELNLSDHIEHVAKR